MTSSLGKTHIFEKTAIFSIRYEFEKGGEKGWVPPLLALIPQWYIPSYNSHPDCQCVKIQLVKGLGIEDPGLWRICPKEYRHLLHNERRQELNKPVKNNILKG